ncbi:hypothetical protein EV182_001081, partial [Spiromyces aspiralis]
MRSDEITDKNQGLSNSSSNNKYSGGGDMLITNPPNANSGVEQHGQMSSPALTIDDVLSRMDDGQHRAAASRADSLASLLISAAEQGTLNSLPISSTDVLSNLAFQHQQHLDSQAGGTTVPAVNDMHLTLDAATDFSHPTGSSSSVATGRPGVSAAHLSGADAYGSIGGPTGVPGAGLSMNSASPFPFSLSDFSSLLNFHTLDINSFGNGPSVQPTSATPAKVENSSMESTTNATIVAAASAGTSCSDAAQQDPTTAFSYISMNLSPAAALMDAPSHSILDTSVSRQRQPRKISLALDSQGPPAQQQQQQQQQLGMNMPSTPLTAGPTSFSSQDGAQLSHHHSLASPIAPYFTSIEQAFEAGLKAGNLLSSISFNTPSQSGYHHQQQQAVLLQRQMQINADGAQGHQTLFGQMAGPNDTGPTGFASIKPFVGLPIGAVAPTDLNISLTDHQQLQPQGQSPQQPPVSGLNNIAMSAPDRSAVFGNPRVPPISYGLPLGQPAATPATASGLPYIGPVGSTRVNQACTTCRRRKIRCDGGKPSCKFCRGKGFKCVYEPPSHSGKGRGKRRSDDPKTSTPIVSNTSDEQQPGGCPSPAAFNSGLSRKRSYRDKLLSSSADDNDLLGISRDEHRYRMRDRADVYSVFENADEDDEEAIKEEQEGDDGSDSDSLPGRFERTATIHELSDRQITLPADMAIRFSMFNLIDDKSELELELAARQSKLMTNAAAIVTATEGPTFQPRQQKQNASNQDRGVLGYGPIESKAETAIHNYFTYFHPQQPILHRPTFEKQVRDGTVDLLLWHCVQAIAARYSVYRVATPEAPPQSDSHGRGKVEKGYIRSCPFERGKDHAAVAIAMLASASRKPTIETIQSFYLLSLHQFGCGNWMDGITFWGTAARIFNQMQLHMLDEAFTYPGYTSHLGEPESRISELTKQQSPAHYGREKRLPATTREEWISREMARRLRWKLFEAERTFNIGTGRPPLVVLDPGWVHMPCSDDIWEMENPMTLGEQERTLLRVCNFYIDASWSIRVNIPDDIKLAINRKVSESMSTGSDSLAGGVSRRASAQSLGRATTASVDDQMEIESHGEESEAITDDSALSESILAQATDYLIMVRKRINRVHLNAHSAIIIGQLTRSRLALFRLFFPCRWPSQFVTKGSKKDPNVDAGGGGGAPGPVIVRWSERVKRMREAINDIENKTRQWQMYVEAVFGSKVNLYSRQSTITETAPRSIGTRLKSLTTQDRLKFEYASYRILASALGIQARSIILQLHNALRMSISRQKQLQKLSAKAAAGGTGEDHFMFSLGRHRTPNDPEPDQGNLAVLESLAQESWDVMTQKAQEIVDLLEIHWRVRPVSRPQCRHFVEPLLGDETGKAKKAMDEAEEEEPRDTSLGLAAITGHQQQRGAKVINVELIDALMADHRYRPRSSAALTTVYKSSSSSKDGDRGADGDDPSNIAPSPLVRQLEYCDDHESTYEPYKLQLSS